MNNRVLKIEDIESNIEIFGNKFELDLSERLINKLKNINIRRIEEDEDVFSQLKNILNLILNDVNAYEKIKQSYESESKKEFGLQAFIRVYEFIFNEYSREIEKINEKNFKVDNNREYRRNYNNRNRYRRY